MTIVAAAATAASVGDTDAPLFPGDWKAPELVVGGADMGENETLFFGISLMSSWAKADPLSVVNCTCLPIPLFHVVWSSARAIAVITADAEGRGTGVILVAAAAAAPSAIAEVALGAAAANAATTVVGDADTTLSADADAMARGCSEVLSNAAAATAAGQGTTVADAAFAAVPALSTHAGLPPPFVSLLLGVALPLSVPLPFALKLLGSEVL